MSSLKEKCIIVQLHTSHWSAKKYSPSVTQEIDEMHQSTDSGRFNKKLLVSKQLDDINSCLGKARTYHYKVTLPWDDAGQRLLPITEYLDYVAKMEEIQTEHKQLVDVFISHYPELRKDAKKRLNTLFDENDYPAERELIRKFDVSYKFTPISDSSDLRVDISKGEFKEIKKNIEAGLQEKVNNAKSSIIDRAKKALESAYEKLSDETATFRDSLITNITELAETIPILNFDNDAVLDELQSKLKRFDKPIEPLRKDMEARKDVAIRCKKVLKYIKTISLNEEIEDEPVKKEKTKKSKKKSKVKRLR
jgi:hypothetical protein